MTAVTRDAPVTMTRRRIVAPTIEARATAPLPVPPPLPSPRGPLSAAVLSRLADGRAVPGRLEIDDGLDPLVDDDLHLALWCCYNLHFDGFVGVDDGWEWDPELLALRARLERAFETALRDEHRATDLPVDVVDALDEIAGWSGPPLASTVGTSGTLGHLREIAIHRSAYQLKEADPHTFGIPRLRGPGRSGMIEIQADEYGGGVPGESHAELFADAMVQLGLDPRPGRYVDVLPGTTLATDNLVAMLGLHRRLRGALVGHLTIFEMCSVTPMSRYLAAARRVGGLPALERFYAVHVEVDEHHARVALDGMAGPFAAAWPSLGPDVVFGAAALSRVESRFARAILDRWHRGRSSLIDMVATPA